MNWCIRFFRSSLGKKLVMALTGLFLIIFKDPPDWKFITVIK